VLGLLIVISFTTFTPHRLPLNDLFIRQLFAVCTARRVRVCKVTHYGECRCGELLLCRVVNWHGSILPLSIWRSHLTTNRLNALQPNDYFMYHYVSYFAGLSGRGVWGVDLRPLACWDCEFEFQQGHGCLFVVSVVCEVEVSAMNWSLVQMWCFVECDLETLWMRRPCPTGGCCAK